VIALLAALGLAPTWAAAPDEVPESLVGALSPVARTFFEEARSLEREGRFADAALRYRAVRSADPAFGPASIGLARVLEAQGRTEEAIGVLRERPFDADALEQLGELSYAADRFDDAAEAWHQLVALRPEWPGALVLEARALARTDVVRAAAVLRSYLGYGGIDPVGDGLVPVAGAVAEELRRTGRRDEAEGLVKSVLAADPDSAGVLADLLVRIEVDLEAVALAEAGDVPLTPPQRLLLREAHERFARGELDGARRQLEVLVLEAQNAAEAWGALAEVREAQGDAVGAEAACRTAMRLDPRSAEWPARLGDLLVRWFAGRYDGEAAASYARALRRRPDDAELWYRRGLAERRSGRWRVGVASMERVLELAPEGPRAAEARLVVQGAALVTDGAPVTVAAHGRPAALTEDAWWAFLRASAWRERHEVWALDEALDELRYVRGAAPRFAPAVALEAEIHTARGDRTQAVAGWEAVLALEPGDPEASARLAELAERAGEPSTALWARAADAGHPGALLRRARAGAASGRWWSARADLRELFARTSSGEVFVAATALDRDLASRVWAAELLGAAGVAGALAVPVAIRWRRRGGKGLDELVAADPAVWRDLARLLSAVRHEVVKHHFGLLEAVASSLDERDPEAARFAAERWFGPAGAVARLRGYVDEIEALGRSVGVRVNLRWRDPRFRPLLEAAEGLSRLEGPLRTAAGPALADGLRRLAGPLGRDAHAALGALIDELCVLQVDAALLLEVHRRAAAEFPGRAVAPPEIAVSGGPLRVRMIRRELEDVLTNLIRNAFEATPLDGDSAVGLFVAVEEDPITFLERVSITVADRAPGALTTRDLRGRHLSRGLGLAVDLVARAGGSISVSPRPGYAKGVVVRVPRVEPGGEAS
jgi:tetratricopeptide (TPR) repeat protein